MNTLYIDYYHVNIETTKLYTDMDTGTGFEDNDGLGTTTSFHDIKSSSISVRSVFWLFHIGTKVSTEQSIH